MLTHRLAQGEERMCPGKQGSPTPRATDQYHLWLVRSQAAQKEVRGQWASKASFLFVAAPQR